MSTLRNRLVGLLYTLGFTLRPDRGIYTDPPSDEEKELMRRSCKALDESKRIDVKMNAGLRQFVIDGHVIWAINQKNAERKAAKLGLK